jgi:hypothetical protein
MATLLKIGFFDTLFEDEELEQRRVLAWRQYHELQGLVSKDVAIQKYISDFEDLKAQIASLTLTPRGLAKIEKIEIGTRELVKKMKNEGASRAEQQEWHGRKRTKLASLDPFGERETLRRLLIEVRKCRKMRTKLKENAQSVTFEELDDGMPSRVVTERAVYGFNLYTNALSPYMERLQAVAKITSKYKVVAPERILKGFRQAHNLVVIGELQTCTRGKYTAKDGSTKTRITGKLVGPKGKVIEVVAFGVSDEAWTSSRGLVRTVVAVAGGTSEYQGKPQVMIAKRTEWTKCFGIEPFEVFEAAYSQLAKR